MECYLEIIGILRQAGNAKKQTNIAEEKEILEQATILAMGKSKYGDIDETFFTNELEKNNATVTKSGSKYKVTFPSERQYTVDQDGNVKEKKVNPNAMKISELNENARTFFGWDIINYAETLPTELQDTKWQLFYAGALDGETEERIYLISKEYVKNTVLPAKNGAAPIPTDGSDYKIAFSIYGGNEGVCSSSIYSGSSDVSTNMQKYNKDYFITKKYSSTNKNMRAVSYMVDTIVWSEFATSSQGYAEWAIGGPTIELLFTAYNKYQGLTGNNTWKARAASDVGYEINIGGSSYKDSFSSPIPSSATPYSVSNLKDQANGYWISSPSRYATNGLSVIDSNGGLNNKGSTYTNTNGFRPLILLDSNYTLEKTKDSNGNDVFKIVEQ